MTPIAHHMAVEFFGREFAPHTTLEHVCTFAALGTVLALAAYGAWTLATKLRGRRGDRLRP